MGSISAKIVILLQVSDHNSEQDRIDRELVQELRNRIADLLQEEKFQDIAPAGVDIEL